MCIIITGHCQIQNERAVGSAYLMLHPNLLAPLKRRKITFKQLLTRETAVMGLTFMHLQCQGTQPPCHQVLVLRLTGLQVAWLLSCIICSIMIALASALQTAPPCAWMPWCTKRCSISLQRQLLCTIFWPTTRKPLSPRLFKHKVSMRNISGLAWPLGSPRVNLALKGSFSSSWGFGARLDIQSGQGSGLLREWH